jgi:uncharacterized protein (DUF1778 family)
METASHTQTGKRKDDRLELRISQEQRRILDDAAAASGMSVSAFVLSHATDAARDLLADRTSFVLPPERWDTFVTMLERDPRPMPGLAAFLARRSLLDE